MCSVNFQLKRHTGYINAITVSPGLDYIATASSDKTVGLTSLADQQTIYIKDHDDIVMDAKFSPDGRSLATCSSDGRILIHNTSTKAKLHGVVAHQLPVKAISWSPDGRMIASGSVDQSICLWSATKLSKKKTLPSLGSPVRDVEWRGDLLAAAVGSSIKLFDQRTWKEVITLPQLTQSDVSSISFHYTGSAIVGGYIDKIFRVFDLRKGTLLQKHAAHTDVITDVDFSPINDDLVTVGRDGYAHLWNLQSAKITANISQHEGSALGCAWLPSGNGFITCGSDRRIFCYSLPTQTVEELDLDIDSYDLMDAIEQMQTELNQLITTMKALDRRLLIQEEKLQWLSDIDEPIAAAEERISERF